MFAGGGSIPLEALRLGCESYAVELNPVAHIIELCTLVYPQKYGPSLVEDVKKWGEWVIARAKEQLAEFYPSPQSEQHNNDTLYNRLLQVRRIPLQAKTERSLQLPIYGRAPFPVLILPAEQLFLLFDKRG